MAIYQGNTKISGSGVQVDNFFSETSTNPVQNKIVTEALEDVGYSTWQKPADWIDIRSGALPNSVYFLVGHSAPTESEGTYTVATYPQFSVYANVSSSGTYDVYVDGIKVATTNSGTATTLDWGTLYTNGTVISGHNVTYPAALVTHIVRVTPSTSTNTFSAFHLVTNSSVNQGVLWCHSTASNAVNFDSLFGAYGASYKCLVLEAMTTTRASVGLGPFMFSGCASLKEVPVFSGSANAAEAFMKTKLKRIKLKGFSCNVPSYSMFNSAVELKEIECEESIIQPSDSTFQACTSLKTLPVLDFSSTTSANRLLRGCTALQDTYVDASNGHLLKRLVLDDTGSNLSGVKGCVVSNQAPFDGSSPQISIAYTGLDRAALVNLFNSMPTVTDSQVVNIIGATGASDLTASDLAIATGKGWTVTR